ncbi:universal stress protein [Halobacteriales archaeon QS_1_68_17]|nr:MAG: universal stress protein [Halobacteriales archaeon QS_1_68_17]
MYETILLPTDGSSGADRAVENAIDMARMYEAALHVLYVVDMGDMPADVDTGTIHTTLEETGRETTERVAERARDAGVETVETAVVSGSPYGTILEYADEQDVDLIVMGTHGRTGLGRFLLGSVTERVVRNSEVPVLTVRLAADEEE